MRLPRAVAAALILLLLGPAAPASAEWFADLYAGAAFTGSRDLIPETDPVFRNVSFDQSLTLGGRVGYWFEDFEYVALALDVLHFQPNIDAQTVKSTIGPTSLGRIDVDLTSLSPQVLVRYPLLRDERFPHGRLQPYFFIGPLAGIAVAKDTSNFGPPANQSHTSVRAGFNVGTGLALPVHKHLAVFVEYRYLNVTPTPRFRDTGEVQFTVNTHVLAGGISVRY